LASTTEQRRRWIDAKHPALSIRQQCELLGLAPSSYYYSPQPETPENLELMRRIDELYTAKPFLGSRRMAVELEVNRKRMQRLMRRMGLEALYPKRNLSKPAPNHLVFPYLLRNVAIDRPNQVWSTDITYVPMRSGFLYLVAVMDWFSRYVLSWELSSTLDAGFCVAALEQAFRHGKPEIFNSDQGSQFTSEKFVGVVQSRGVRVSMDGRGRCLDNVFIERLWRTVKYESIYISDFEDGRALWEGLDAYFRYYNHERRHQALQYRTPAAVHYASKERNKEGGFD
jgi:putative transposase